MSSRKENIFPNLLHFQRGDGLFICLEFDACNAPHGLVCSGWKKQQGSEGVDNKGRRLPSVS